MRTYLYISYKCNCNCFFCASDETNMIRNNNEVSLEEAKKFILSSPNKENLVISGGEPTIHKDFFDIVRFAKQHCKHVGLMTNGIKFADLDFLKATIDAGIDRISIPIYTADNNDYNTMVGTVNAFDQFTRGLSNINSLLPNKSFELQIKLLLAKFTYKHNPDLIDYIKNNYPNIKRISLFGFHISNKALQHSKQCIINYRESCSYNDMVINKLIKHDIDFHVCEIPLCAFSDETIAFLLKNKKIAYTDDTYLKRPDSKTKFVGVGAYCPEECNKCALKDLCPKIQEKNASLFNHGLRPIIL